MIQLAAPPCPPAPARAPAPRQVSAGERHHELQRLAIQGITLSVFDSGPATADHTVVFLPGFCLTHATWTDHIDRLLGVYGPSVRAISYDQRGHGASAQAPMSTYTIDQLAADLADLLAALHVGPQLTLVGHSMGGMVALSYLSRRPSQRPVDPTGLVLVATAAGKLAQRGLGRLLGTPATNAVVHTAAHVPDRVLRGLLAPLCASLTPIRARVPTGGIASLTLTALSTTAPSTAIGYLPSLRTYDVSHTLSAIDARTVVVSGGVDPVTPVQHSHELADSICGAIHLHAPTAGHMLPQQCPDLIHRGIEHASGLACPPQLTGRSRRRRRAAGSAPHWLPATAPPPAQLVSGRSANPSSLN